MPVTTKPLPLRRGTPTGEAQTYPVPAAGTAGPWIS